MAQAKRPKLKVTDAHCNGCGGKKKHDVLASHSATVWETETDENGKECGYPYDGVHEILRCRGCERISFRIIEEEQYPEYNTYVQYPPPVFRRRPRWSVYRPRRGPWTLIDEIYRALAADSRCLAMMGARAVIDVVLKDSVGDNGSFRDRLLRLESSGAVGRQERQVLETALDAGNASSHRGYQPSIEILNRVMDIVEHLLQARYVLPQSAAEVKKRTPKRPGARRPPAKVVAIDRKPAS